MEYQSTNLKKYAIRNPIVRRLINSFLAKIKLASQGYDSVIEAGCGEGFVLNNLDVSFKVGVDISFDALLWAKNNFGNINFLQGDIYTLPFADDSSQLVLALEVLEHLESPENAIKELKRVSCDTVIISVPYEPFFRLGNLARGKHILRIGNHPEHIQQFNKRRFKKIISENFNTYSILVSFPWLIGICKVK